MKRKTHIAFLVSALVIALLLLLRILNPKNGMGAESIIRTSPLAKQESHASSAVATCPADPHDLQQVSAHPLAISFGKNPDHALSEPMILLEILQFYRMEFGSFPAGQENRDIMNALTGNNTEKMPVFPRKHPRIDASGNLLDAWGTPFNFHPISSQYLEIRSSGPDREIFTDDDILVPAPHAQHQ